MQDTDTILWVALDVDPPVDPDTVDELAAALQERTGHELIITTKDVEPMDKAELREALEE